MQLTTLQETGVLTLRGPTSLRDILDGLHILGIGPEDVVVQHAVDSFGSVRITMVEKKR